jgi:hypothetical protein
VLAAASRRPSTAEIAVAIASDDRWLLDAGVREALCENPFSPGWLSALLRLCLARSPAGARSAERAEPFSDDAP